MAYLVVRRWIPGRGIVKGVAFGIVLLVVAGPVVLDGNYEFFRFVSPWTSLALFGLLYPLYGVVVSPLTERLGRGTQGKPRNRFVVWSGDAVLAGVVVWSLRQDNLLLRDVFHLL